MITIYIRILRYSYLQVEHKWPERKGNKNACGRSRLHLYLN